MGSLVQSELTLVVPDTHAPFHDVGWWRTVKQIASTVKPRRIVCIGDFVDCYSVTMHLKDPNRPLRLADEINEGASMLSELRSYTKDLWFTCGNHERRLERYIAERAPELASTHPTVRQLLGVPEQRWVPYMRHVTLGEVSFTHDLGHAGKGALSQTLDAFGHCIVFGHTHRAGTLYDGDVTGKHRFSLNVGWGGDVETIDYMHRAKTRAWQLGIGVIEQTRSGLVWASFVPYVGGQMVVRGQVFGRPERKAV